MRRTQVEWDAFLRCGGGQPRTDRHTEQRTESGGHRARSTAIATLEVARRRSAGRPERGTASGTALLVLGPPAEWPQGIALWDGEGQFRRAQCSRKLPAAVRHFCNTFSAGVGARYGLLNQSAERRSSVSQRSGSGLDYVGPRTGGLRHDPALRRPANMGRTGRTGGPGNSRHHALSRPYRPKGKRRSSPGSASCVSTTIGRTRPSAATSWRSAPSPTAAASQVCFVPLVDRTVPDLTPVGVATRIDRGTPPGQRRGGRGAIRYNRYVHSSRRFCPHVAGVRSPV
jgi:hypothetical protein